MGESGNASSEMNDSGCSSDVVETLERAGQAADEIEKLEVDGSAIDTLRDVIAIAKAQRDVRETYDPWPPLMDAARRLRQTAESMKEDKFGGTPRQRLNEELADFRGAIADARKQVEAD